MSERLVAMAAVGMWIAGSAAAQSESEPTFDESAELTAQLVVMVSRGANEPAGAGIVVGRRDNTLFVVTANHVVRRPEPASDLMVAFRSRPAAPVAATLLPSVDRPGDLAVMEVSVGGATGIDACALPFDRLAASTAAKRGDAVYALGNPNGIAWGMPVQPEYVAQITGNEIAFQSAFISAGHSGGALLDAGGKLVGLIRADQPPLGLATDLKTVLETVTRWGYPVQLRAALPLDRTPLHTAAQRGDTALIAELLADCGNVNAVSTHDETPLHFAAAGGHVDAIALLASAGADLNAMDGDGDTPLHWAVQAGQPAAVTRLLQAGADASPVNNGRKTPLHEAVARRYFGQDELPEAVRLQMVRLLIQGRAAVNGDDSWSADDTPLHRAVLEQQHEMAQLLIAAGAKPIAGDLTGAVAKHDVPLIERLIAARADLDAEGEYIVGPGDSGKDTPLVLATRLGHLDTVKLLVAAGADIDHPGFLSYTPLASAMEYGNRDVESFLIGLGARADTGSASSNETLLWEAVAEKRTEAVARLIADGVDVNGRQGRSLVQSLLWIALEGQDPTIVRMLVEAGADVNEWVLGETPLSRAVKTGNADIVAAVLRGQADPEEGGAGPPSPLESAVKVGSIEIVRLLLDAGADPTAHGSAALELAGELRHDAIAALIRSRAPR